MSWSTHIVRGQHWRVRLGIVSVVDEDIGGLQLARPRHRPAEEHLAVGDGASGLEALELSQTNITTYYM